MQYFHQATYGNLGGVHTLQPQMVMRGNAVYNTRYNPAGASAQPVFMVHDNTNVLPPSFIPRAKVSIRSTKSAEIKCTPLPFIPSTTPPATCSSCASTTGFDSVFLVRRSKLAVTSFAARPCLAVPSADGTLLRLTKSTKSRAGGIVLSFCARERNRTSTPVRATPPQGVMSTSFNTRACY